MRLFASLEVWFILNSSCFYIFYSFCSSRRHGTGCSSKFSPVLGVFLEARIRRKITILHQVRRIGRGLAKWVRLLYWFSLRFPIPSGSPCDTFLSSWFISLEKKSVPNWVGLVCWMSAISRPFACDITLAVEGRRDRPAFTSKICQRTRVGWFETFPHYYS